MKALGIDTSGAVAAVAVVDGDRLLGEFLINHKRTHSQRLMPMLEQTLSALELAPSDIDIFAAAVGPGSFTGLRIGISAVKGLAMALDKPVAAISSLDAMAYNLPFCTNLICPMFDARNNQVYSAVYRWDDAAPRLVIDRRAVDVAHLLKDIKSMGEAAVFLGDGAAAYRGAIEDALGGMCLFAPPQCNMQRASSTAYAALELARRDGLITPDRLVPEYLRKPQAERERERRRAAKE